MAYNIDFQVAAASEIEAALGAHLEEIRLSQNMSQAQLARHSGVSRRTITRLGNGGGVSLDTFIRIVQALGLGERLADLLPPTDIQPIQRIRNSTKKKRQRARPVTKVRTEKWTWSDEGSDP